MKEPVRKREANQYTGGNLLTNREAVRMKKYMEALWDLIFNRGMYTKVQNELFVAYEALEKALKLSDRW